MALKPKAPKKKDIKPQAKSGEVREGNSNPYEYKSEFFKSGLYKELFSYDWTDKTEFPTYYIMFDINNSDKDK